MMWGFEPEDGMSDERSFTRSYDGVARPELRAVAASILVEHEVAVKDEGQTATYDNRRRKSKKLSCLISQLLECLRKRKSKHRSVGSGILDEEAHLGLYREARNVAVGLYIHCNMISFAHQCVGVTLIDEAQRLL